MITRAVNGTIFNKIASNYAYFAPVMHTSYSLYAHKNTSFADFYTQGRSAAFMVMGQNATICGNVKNTNELDSFLSFIGITSVKSNNYIPAGFTAKGLCVMTRISFSDKAKPDNCVLNDAPSLYDLSRSACIANTEVYPDDFYSDACIRKAHGFADILTLEGENKEILSTAGIYSANENEAYIAVVSTPTMFRGRGYASFLVNTLCKRHFDKKLTLVCDADIKAFYEALGFAQTDVVMSAKIIK